MKAYKYSIRVPHDQEELIDRQIGLAHTYYNRLIEALRASRQAVREIRGRFGAGELQALRDQLAAQEVVIDEILDRISSYKVTNRTRKVSPELAAELAAAKAVRTDIRTRMGVINRRLREDPEVIRLTAEQNERHHARTLELRAQIVQEGLYWGTYLKTEEAYEQAITAKARQNREDIAKGVRITDPDPGFRRWDGDGLIAVQLQDGLSVDEMFSEEDTRFRVQRPAMIDDDGRVRAPHLRVLSRMRIGTVEGRRAPVWLTFTTRLHRVPEPGSLIKWVTLSRHIRPGRRPHHRPAWDSPFSRNRFDYTISLTAETPVPKIDVSGRPSIGIDVGWRVVPEGLRVATWRDSVGRRGELVLPAIMLQAHEHSRAIISDAHRYTLDFISRLTEPRLLEALAPTRDVVGWKVNVLMEAFDQIEDLRPLLAEWRSRYLHLHRYSRGIVRRSIAQRLDIYRNFAKRISDQYGELYLEQFDLSEMAEMVDTSVPEEVERIFKRNRAIAGISILRGVLENKMQTLLKVPAEYTTRTCECCGHVNQWGSQSPLLLTCRNCGVTWDQDHNASANILSLGVQGVEAAA